MKFYYANSDYFQDPWTGFRVSMNVDILKLKIKPRKPEQGDVMMFNQDIMMFNCFRRMVIFLPRTGDGKDQCKNGEKTEKLQFTTFTEREGDAGKFFLFD